ncbi:Protein rds1 [Tolypocladium paradoxum]|uniref:Protein rds1 n=1 Tax=Tolypocladium paradoxum TaxID=94208 RepID=A0A2S4L0S3_9HYPO|nr:Protein rds1 [Tolypocladium paradoxum]
MAPPPRNAGVAADAHGRRSALTLENLEETFYREGFQRFPDADFAALGLSERQVQDLKDIGRTEQAHVGLLQSSLAQGGVQPVQPCTYDFQFTNAAAMVQTAAVLENVGVSAYLGAAPLLADKGILGTAGSILTIESRHQSAIRVFARQAAIPQAFDAPLGPRAVFSIAKPFIKECPQGSNLVLQPFPALAMQPGQDAAAMAVGSVVRVAAEGSAASGAQFCAFTSGGVFPGGSAFSPFSEANGCAVPQGVAGVSYLSLTSMAPQDGVLKDEMVLAGPMVMAVS